jgi:mevalonate kinase
MPVPTEASACAKIILCGEHSVVYGRPAIALPLPNLRTTVRVRPRNGVFQIHATDIGHVVHLPQTPPTQRPRPHPLALITYLTFERLDIRPPRALAVIRSGIPVGSNLGSGAAVSIALARALAAHAGKALDADTASALAYEVEKLHHGTPSGIDNTVIAHELPVRFVRGEPVQVLSLAPLNLVIGDSGESTPTRIPVGDVRAAWERDPAFMERQFDHIAALVEHARDALQRGDIDALGRALNDNHAILRELTVSSPQLDALCDAARAAGAPGAKMSGGGRGGNMLALAHNAAHAEQIKTALLAAGARRVFL